MSPYKRLFEMTKREIENEISDLEDELIIVGSSEREAEIHDELNYFYDQLEKLEKK